MLDRRWPISSTLIAVASDNGQNVAESFRAARLYMVYDVQEGRVDRRETRHKPYDDIGTGRVRIGKAQDMEQPILDCDVLIAGKISRLIYRRLIDMDITVVLTTLGNADEAVAAYLQNQLPDHPELVGQD